MTKCPVCGSESQNNEEICKNCGSKLPKKKTEKTVVEQKIQNSVQNVVQK